MLKNFRTYQLSKELYRKCKGIRTEQYMRDQLLRASLSVVLNLAEGSAKPTEKERRRFYSINMASLREVQSILDLLEEKDTFQLADDLGGMLFVLVRR